MGGRRTLLNTSASFKERGLGWDIVGHVYGVRVHNWVRIVKEGNKHGELTNRSEASHSKGRKLGAAGNLFGRKGNKDCLASSGSGIVGCTQGVASSLQSSE